ncbi:hypothetical protein C8F04DRAFT_1254984 [Mycena alexandri]|uniref:Uncharacterized protein n=1 Tax=Mycena alexandri TaxID=1745969 RepID=A0AAD6XBK7_9AGAR|nr:hypothetical protein C8F04DRAFT_1254984 [Mycena alexandri]
MPAARPMTVYPTRGIHKHTGNPRLIGWNSISPMPVSLRAVSWVGLRSKEQPQRPTTLAEIHEREDEVLEWNGRDPKLIVDSEGRIIAILLGTSGGSGLARCHPRRRQGYGACEAHCSTPGAFRAGRIHRRGRYLPLTSGVSFGGGQRIPGNLCNSRLFRQLIRTLLQNRSIRRIAGFQSCGFALYAPKLYRYYCEILRALFEHHPELIHNFSNSVFPAATFNCGNAVTFQHCDILNLVHGLCPITSGGNFEHKLGGHIYLKQLKLAIEFPSGSTVIITSGCVDHGNTPIRQKETRYSMTQFAAAGLFRWVTYGFQSAKSLLA